MRAAQIKSWRIIITRKRSDSKPCMILFCFNKLFFVCCLILKALDEALKAQTIEECKAALQLVISTLLPSLIQTGNYSVTW